MGLFFRKSVRVGPFRFNLSGSGIGVSCGIPGLRVGTGPRGNYISAGRGGIYYRAALPTARPRPVHIPPTPTPNFTGPQFDPTLGEFKAVDSGVSFQMQDVSSQSLLDELNDKRKRPSLAPFVLIASIIAGVLLFMSGYPPFAIELISAILLILIVVAAIRDTIKKTTVLMYDLDADAMLAFASLTSAFDKAAGSKKIWHVQSQAAVLDQKYHAGATAELKTDDSNLTKAAPSKLKTNVQPLAIPSPGRSLYLFPDRLLVSDAVGFGAIDYQRLEVNLSRGQFIPGTTSPPQDAKVVEYTWRYVNKGGGPDRRFANNPQLPVIEVRDLSLESRSGFKTVLKFSDIVAAEHLRDALVNFAVAHAQMSAPDGENISPPVPAPSAGVTKPNWAVPAVVALLLAAAAAIAIALYPQTHDQTPVFTASIVSQTPMPEPEATASAMPQVSRTIATPSPSATTSSIQSVQIPHNRTSQGPPAPSRETSGSHYVTLRASVSIITATGRVTLNKGTRLPLVRIKNNSAIVHYYDGRDYPVPLSATNPQ